MKFYPKGSPESTYKRLNELARSRYIQCLSSRTGTGGVWTLTDLGYASIKEELGELAVSGYKSESLSHDLLSMAAMTGEWLTEEPSGVALFSEQELRRIDPSHYPQWVPQTDEHRSDGYWRCPRLKENGSIALELERTPKSLKRYELVAEFYRDHKFVSGVLWVTPFQGATSRIAEKMRDYLGEESSRHWFVSLDEFTRLGWQSQIRIGKASGHTISNLMWKLAGKSQPTLPGVDSRLILQTRKFPRDFSPDSILQTHAFFD
jgi:hypothetical protein